MYYKKVKSESGLLLSLFCIIKVNNNKDIWKVLKQLN